MISDTMNAETLLQSFLDGLSEAGRIEALRAGLIGGDATIDGPFGPKPLIYADYVASGRALQQIEDFVVRKVLPYYANSHTEASFCGSFMTRLRQAARRVVAQELGADERYAVIFTGSGATAGLNRLVSLLGVSQAARRGERPVVFVGPYEHHSNILPWRESGAEVVELDEAADGGPDLAGLEAALRRHADRTVKVGSFSAMSNVTGIVTNPDPVTRLLRDHGALSVWDYAGGAPYLPMAMAPDGTAAKDALVFSPHKFPGGPGASGVLVVRRAAVVTDTPTWPGGGTVSFVSPWHHDYAQDLASREEAGTPNVIGDIRVALAMLVKKAVGQEYIEQRNRELNALALSVWRANPRIELLGADAQVRLPIFSFRVRDGRGGFVHHQLFTRMLSDHFGIQARGGCACAGPYAHRLLGIDRATSEAIREHIRRHEEIEKPGWVRLNLSYLLSDAKARDITTSVDRLAREAPHLAEAYHCDQTTARFSPLQGGFIRNSVPAE